MSEALGGWRHHLVGGGGGGLYIGARVRGRYGVRTCNSIGGDDSYFVSSASVSVYSLCVLCKGVQRKNNKAQYRVQRGEQHETPNTI